MSNPLLTIYLGGVLLPDQIWLIESTTPNAADVRTMDGSLYTDFINYYRSWTIAFDQITGATWNTLMTLYKIQYENETYLTLECDALSINTIVKLDVGDKFVTWSGNMVGDGTQQYYPTLTLQEQSAIS
jgi:hypothetical protein